MNSIFSNSINMNQKLLDYLWKKQGVVTDNIANQDTPNFKAKYVTFEETLDQKIKESKGELEYKKAIDNSKIEVKTTQNETARLDGNNVIPDAEYVELARTTLQYQYALRAINDDFTRLRSVIKGQ